MNNGGYIFYIKVTILGLVFALQATAAESVERFPISEIGPSAGIMFNGNLLGGDFPVGVDLLLDLFSNHRKKKLSIFIIGESKNDIDLSLNRLVATPLGVSIAELKAIHDVIVIEKKSNESDVLKAFLLGRELPQLRGLNSLWVRDFGPIFTKQNQGNVYQLSPVDFKYHPDKPSENSLIKLMSSQRFFYDHIESSLKIEGGNIEFDDRSNCFVSTKVLKDNPYLAATHEEKKVAFKNAFKKLFGCENVNMLDQVSFESTGHLDTWMKYVGNNTFLIADVTDEVIESQKYFNPSLISDLIKIKSELDHNAKILSEDLGYSLIRLPIFPIESIQAGHRFFTGENFNVFRSFTNSLYVNGTLFVPSYKNSFENDRLVYSQVSKIEGLVYEKIESIGLRVVQLDASNMIYFQGAIHCAFLQIPEGSIIH